LKKVKFSKKLQAQTSKTVRIVLQNLKIT